MCVILCCDEEKNIFQIVWADRLDRLTCVIVLQVVDGVEIPCRNPRGVMYTPSPYKLRHAVASK